MNPGILNLHNHTPFSDGAYTIDEIVEAHLDLKEIKVAGVGISDHLFCTPTSREVTNEREYQRIFAAEARNYVAEVRAARERWGDKIRIYCGAEINWPKNKGMFKLIPDMLEGIDYVLFEYVDWAGLTQLANAARRFPCPIGLAHADVSREYPKTPHDQIVRTLANARIFYEISSKFMPLNDFDPWYSVLPQHRVQVAIGTDTHDDLHCLRDIQPMHEFAVRKGLGDKFVAPGPRARGSAATPTPAMSA
ncbi:MAG: hypothetical protein JNG88_15875 [Phycisphaerales bacterium]|nr:hypothetical protein [Phycisphaerales bacterium]